MYKVHRVTYGRLSQIEETHHQPTGCMLFKSAKQLKWGELRRGAAHSGSKRPALLFSKLILVWFKGITVRQMNLMVVTAVPPAKDVTPEDMTHPSNV